MSYKKLFFIKQDLSRIFLKFCTEVEDETLNISCLRLASIFGSRIESPLNPILVRPKRLPTLEASLNIFCFDILRLATFLDAPEPHLDDFQSYLEPKRVTNRRML